MILIDAEWLRRRINGTGLQKVILLDNLFFMIANAPTIKTKQVKYFDEDEKVWKIGNVIVEPEETKESDPCDGCMYDNDESVLACVACVLREKCGNKKKGASDDQRKSKHFTYADI